MSSTARPRLYRSSLNSPLEQSGFELWVPPRVRHPRQPQGSLLTPLLEEAGFELVWGFSCQVVVLGFAESSLFGAGKPFFIPSPAIRFAERAEGVKGPKR